MVGYKYIVLLFVLIVYNYSFASINLIADESVVYQVENPKEGCLYNPTIVTLNDGRIIIGFEISGKQPIMPKKIGSGNAVIYTSDDNGNSWDYRTNYQLLQSRLFVAKDVIYCLGHIGHRGDNGIIKSDDNGETWSELSMLTKGQLWHSSSHNVITKDDYVYLVRERRDVNVLERWWDVSEFTPVLMRGQISKDLMNPNAWTFASALPFCEAVNDKELAYFGIPFFKAFYPERTMVKKGVGFPPIGWLESNIIQITDPNHYWYDPSGKTFHILSRAHTGRTNLAALSKAVEKSDGSIETMLETAPSGKELVYTPLPGGQMKFFILYDEESKMYWLLSTQSTDSMTRAEQLPEGRHGAPDNERRRLQLSFSKNAVDWCFAGMVAIGEVEKASRHYASMAFRGDDIVVLSRSGNKDARTAHDGNIITFHRIKNFRDLIY